MAQVKFYKGSSSVYENKWKAEDHSGLTGAIWFTTDTNEIILNGIHYAIDIDCRLITGSCCNDFVYLFHILFEHFPLLTLIYPFC